MAIFGLLLIVIAWAIQFGALFESTELNIFFLIFYALGAFLLVFDGYTNSASSLVITKLNLLSLIVAICVVIVLLAKKKHKKK